MHDFWPLSIFKPKWPVPIDLLTVTLLIFLFGLMIVWWRRQIYFPLIYLLGMGFLIGSNLLQGYQTGLIHPISGHGYVDQGYWQDAQLADSPLWWLTHYNELQPTLSYHGKNHPPGPVLFLSILRLVSHSPLLAALMIGVGSLVLATVVYGWIKEAHGEDAGRFALILFLLMPAVQIYSIASVDILIALFFTLSLYFVTRRTKGWKRLVGYVFLGMSLLFSFASLWLMGTITLWLWIKKEGKITHLWLFLVGLILVLKEFGYDYFSGLQTATAFEGFREGPMLLVHPLSYIVTRFQDILEPMVFSGPVFLYFLLKTLTYFKKPESELQGLFNTGVMVFIGFILMGAYYTGETARAALFLVPLALMAVVSYLFDQGKLRSHSGWLLVFAFTQGILMQLFGYYTW